MSEEIVKITVFCKVKILVKIIKVIIVKIVKITKLINKIKV